MPTSGVALRGQGCRAAGLCVVLVLVAACAPAEIDMICRRSASDSEVGIGRSYLRVDLPMHSIRFTGEEIQSWAVPPELHVPVLRIVVTVVAQGLGANVGSLATRPIELLFEGKWKRLGGPNPARTDVWEFVPEKPVVAIPVQLAPPVALLSDDIHVTVSLEDNYVKERHRKSILDRLSGLLSVALPLVQGNIAGLAAFGVGLSQGTLDKLDLTKNVLDRFHEQSRQVETKKTMLFSLTEPWLVPGAPRPSSSPGSKVKVPRYLVLAPRRVFADPESGLGAIADGFDDLDAVGKFVAGKPSCPVFTFCFEPMETVFQDAANTITMRLPPDDGIRQAFLELQRQVDAAGGALEPDELAPLLQAAMLAVQAKVEAKEYLPSEVQVVKSTFVACAVQRVEEAVAVTATRNPDEAAMSLGGPAAVPVEERVAKMLGDEFTPEDVAGARAMAGLWSGARLQWEFPRQVLGSDPMAAREWAYGKGSLLEGLGLAKDASWADVEAQLKTAVPNLEDMRLAYQVLYALDKAGVSDPMAELKLRPVEALQTAIAADTGELALGAAVGAPSGGD